MSEEEKKYIEIMKEYFNRTLDTGDKFILGKIFQSIENQEKEIEELKQEIKQLTKEKEHWKDEAVRFLNKCLEKDKEIVKLKDIIKTIRHELKGNIIVKDDKGYAPAKNLTKQEVYESYVKLITLLKANYIFKEDEDVIKELLDEYKW